MLSDFKPSNYTHNSTVYFPLWRAQSLLPFGTVFIQNTYKISVIFLSWREKEDRKHKSSVAGRSPSPSAFPLSALCVDRRLKKCYINQ